MEKGKRQNLQRFIVVNVSSENNIDMNEEKIKSTPKDYVKALGLGLTISIVVGVILGVAIWYFESIYEIIIAFCTIIVVFITRVILRKPHQLLTMLVCALTAFVNPVAIYLTMDALNIEFEKEYFIYIWMVIAPLAGLYFGYMKTKDPAPVRAEEGA